MQANPSPAAVSLYDARPFFEKALQHGLRNGTIDALKCEAIATEAPKGMVQIARYFGNEFLRPELEKARERMVNLVSLYLESTCDSDLQRAAESLRDHSFLSRSKGGSDMLKALIGMPQTTHFGMNEPGGFTDKHIALLAKWSLRSLADYRAELAQRQQVAEVVDAAIWLAEELGLDAADLDEAGRDAEAVIRTALLVLATGRTEMPDWVAFEKMVTALRKQHAGVTSPVSGSKKTLATAAKSRGASRALASTFSIELPDDLPEASRAVVETLRLSVMADLPKILDPGLSARQLFDHSPSFIGRYFWMEDGLSEVDNHDRQTSAIWARATGGANDDGSLLTLFLCLAAGVSPKTLLTEKGAATLIRKIRKTGLDADLPHQFIAANAPPQHQQDYACLWTAFLEESRLTLESDAFSSLEDALAILRLECNVK